MTDDRHLRLEQLFLQVCESSPTARDALVAEVQASDPDLAAELSSLLEMSDEPEPLASFFERARPKGQEPLPPDSVPLPTTIGPYKIVGLLSSGGMGTVYTATQESPRRMVALKTIRPGFVTQELLRRFESEVTALARLRDPGIAQIYDSGVHDSEHGATPYFTMEYVPNARSITDYAQDLPIEDKLRLFLRVCDAVGHGHRNGVIHRDLKPDNVLIDGTVLTPQPKVIDFGVARVAETDSSAALTLTTAGQLVGTLQYMSPEQVGGDPSAIDVRSDVYSLGLILYEMLSDRLPYDVQSLPVGQAVLAITTTGPERLAVDDRRLRGDLETIVHKAIAKAPDGRYDSAQELAADICRYLDREPITARPPSLWYQLRVFGRRHRVLAVAALTVLVMGVLATFVSTKFALDAHRREASLERVLYRSNMLLASDAITNHEAASARRLLDEAPVRLRGWEWAHLAGQVDGRKQVLDKSANWPTGWSLLTMSAADTVMATLEAGGVMRVWNPATGEVTDPLRPMHEPFFASISDDGSRLVAATIADSGDGWLEEWRLDESEGVWRHLSAQRFVGGPLEPAAKAPALDPNALRAVLVTDRELLLYDIEEDTILAREPGLESAWPWYGPMHRFVLVSGYDSRGALRTEIRDPGTLKLKCTLEEPTERVVALAASANGKRMVTIVGKGPAQLWNTERECPTLIRSLEETPSIRVAALSLDGTQLATAGTGDVIELSDTRTGDAIRTLVGHAAPVVCLAYVPGTDLLVSADVEGEVCTWDTADVADTHVLRGHKSYVYPLLLTDGGSTLVSGGWDGFAGHPGALRVWDVRSGRQLREFGEADRVQSVRALAALPGGRKVAVGRVLEYPSRDLSILDLDAGTWESWLETDESVGSIAIDPKGERLAFTSRAGTLRVIEIESGRDLLTRSVGYTSFSEYYRVAWSPDGRLLAVSLSGYRIQIWDARTYEVLHEIDAHRHGISAVAFDPQSKWIVSTSEDKTAAVWDASTGQEIGRLTGSGSGILSVAIHPDGSRIATGSRDGRVRFWSTTTFDEVARLTGHQDYVYSLVWSPDGRRLYSGSGDGTIRIWESRTEEPVLATRRRNRSP